MFVVKLLNGYNTQGGVKYINGTVGVKTRDQHLECNLESGTYAFFAEVEWVQQESFKTNEFAMTRYGPGEAQF